MTYLEKYKLLPEEFKTAREIGMPAQTLGAMVRRNLAEVKNTTPKQYRKTANSSFEIFLLLEENKDDYDTYFTLRKSNQKLGMLCSFNNGIVLDCWGAPYDLSNVNRIEFNTKSFNL